MWQPVCAAMRSPPRRSLVNVPGTDALSRYTGTEDLLFKIRKNLFETLTFVARKPPAVTRAEPGGIARDGRTGEARRRSLVERAAASWIVRFVITAVILGYLGDTIDMSAAARAVVAIEVR